MAAFCELEASYSPISTEKMFSCNQEISGFLSTKSYCAYPTNLVDNRLRATSRLTAVTILVYHTSSVSRAQKFVLFLFYLPYLSSIHEKANCIAILWTGSPHSLGSCLFRGLWATCLPHKGGGVPLSALPKDTTSELAGLFSTTSPKCRTPSREAADAIF